MSKRPLETEDGPPDFASDHNHAHMPIDVKKQRFNGNQDLKTLFCRNLEYSATEEDLRNISFFSNWGDKSTEFCFLFLRFVVSIFS